MTVTSNFKYKEEALVVEFYTLYVGAYYSWEELLDNTLGKLRNCMYGVLAT